MEIASEKAIRCRAAVDLQAKVIEKVPKSKFSLSKIAAFIALPRHLLKLMNLQFFSVVLPAQHDFHSKKRALLQPQILLQKEHAHRAAEKHCGTKNKIP